MRAFNWLSYPRSFFLIAFGAVWTFILSVAVIVTALIDGRSRAVDFILRDLWCGFLLFLFGVDVEMRGDLEVLKQREGFLLLFNHVSHLDIITLFAKIPRRIRFGAKIELFSIPVFGEAMRRIGILPIDRRNRNKVLGIYRAAVPRVKAGECFALAPEGTRQKEAKLGSFKRGPFEFAILAQMPIVPVILAGTSAVWPKNSAFLNVGRWRRKVILEILPPIATSSFQLEQAADLQEQVFEAMLVAHARLHGAI